MEGEILPPGSVVLLSIISVSGFLTWWLNYFTQRNELVNFCHYWNSFNVNSFSASFC